MRKFLVLTVLAATSGGACLAATTEPTQPATDPAGKGIQSYFASPEMTIKSLTFILAAVTAFIALRQYRHQVRLKQVEFYLQLDKAYTENAAFSKIREILHRSETKGITEEEQKKVLAELLTISKKDRNDFAGFLELIWTLVRKGQIPKDIVSYMFAGDVLRCSSWNKQFWNGFHREKGNWTVFDKFARKMAKRKKAQPEKLESARLH